MVIVVIRRQAVIHSAAAGMKGRHYDDTYKSNGFYRFMDSTCNTACCGIITLEVCCDTCMVLSCFWPLPLAAAGLSLGFLMFALSSAVKLLTNPRTAKEIMLERIEYYQKNVSPRLSEARGVERKCRFTPSCSQYAKEAVQMYGAGKGGWMAFKRLLRCNPFSKGGCDPVPKPAYYLPTQ